MLDSDINILNLAASHRERLKNNGYRSVRDIENSENQDIVNTTMLTYRDVQMIKDEIQRWRQQLQPASVVTLLGNPPIIIPTGCQALDQLLGGGIKSGQLTEIIGQPGVGKTQLAMQLCIQVQLTNDQFRALYIDVDGSLNQQRIAQIMLGRQMSNLQQQLRSGIVTIRAKDVIEQFAACGQLNSILQNNSRIKLVVIDSVAFHLRQKFCANRTQALIGMAQGLSKVAQKHKVAIVVTNQVTFRGNNRVPTLGESWSHMCPTQILMEINEQGVRTATLVKSSERPLAKVNFQITGQGLVNC